MNLSEKMFFKMKNALEEKFISGEYKAPDNAEPVIADDEANINFIVWGDSQVSNYMFARECSLKVACEDVKNAKGKLDALVICGDIAENGMKCEYKMTTELINSCSASFNNFIAMPGNHDVRLRRYKHQIKRFSEFVSNIHNGVTIKDKYWFSKEISGYKFIVMGTDSATFEGAYISNEQLNWLDKEIKSTQGSGKPVFVFNHQTLKKTNGLPNTWLGKGKWRGSIGNQSEKVKAIFEKYDNVIFITGHLHWGMNEYSIQNCGKFTAVSVPTIGAGNHGKFNANCQGYIFSVYDDKIIIRGRDFEKGRYIDKQIKGAYEEIRL